MAAISASSSADGCLEGRFGQNCQLCLDDEACWDEHGDGARCDTSMTFSAAVPVKTFACSVSDNILSNIVADTDVEFTCHLADGVCTLPISLKDGSRPPAPAKCVARDCALSGSEANCSDMKCSCDAGPCPGPFGRVFEGLSGETRFSCEDSGACILQAASFPFALPLECSAGSCVPEAAEIAGSDTQFGGPGSATPDTTSEVVSAILPIAVIFGFVLSVFFVAVVLDLIHARTRAKAPKSVHQDVEETRDGSVAGVTKPEAARVDIACRDVSCWIAATRGSVDAEDGDSERFVLRGVSIAVASGDCLGVLGPSGSGKTTFLTTVAAMLPRGVEVSGSVTFSASGAVPSDLRDVVAFLPQEELLMPTLTVEEWMTHQARLALPVDTRADEIRARVDDAIARLRLSRVRGSRIGGGGGAAGCGRRGISGGERRRCMIASSAIIPQKPVLVLDEPFSGLDSFSARSLMTDLRDLAASGRTVILSVHQPGPQLFSQLDRVLLLAQGRPVYFGPPSSVDVYFGGCGVERPRGESVADFMLHAVSDPEQLSALLRRPNVVDVSWEHTSRRNGAKPQSAAVCASLPVQDASRDTRAPARSARRARACAVPILLRRQWLDMLRTPNLLALQFSLMCGVGLLGGLVFWRLGMDTQGAQDRAGAVFFALTLSGFAALTAVDPFLRSRALLTWEMVHGLYRPWEYAVVHAALDTLALRALPAVAFCTPLYFMAGFQLSAPKILAFYGVVGIFSAVSGSLALVLGTVSPSVSFANLLLVVFLLLSLILAGFLVNVSSLAAWVAWLRWISPIYYALETLVANEFDGLVITFQAAGYSLTQVPGAVFVETLGLSMDNALRNTCVLCGMYAGLLPVAAGLLWARVLASRASMRPRDMHRLVGAPGAGR
ncbi:unnamed protein product [Pedinophyceae sp. YPF-701]|nr:unnamed protein product [Pedinophyceae sp. YPF-701]